MNRKHVIQNYYAKRANVYDKQKRRTWTSKKGFSSQILSIILEFTRQVDSGQILEIGIGTGRIAHPVLENTSGNVIGIDLSSKMIEKSVKKLEQYSTRSHLILGDGEYPPFRNSCFHCLICISTFHYLSSPQIRVRSFTNLLKSGAPFIFGDLVIHEKDTEKFLDQLEHLLTPPHNQYHYPTDLLQMLVESGFQVEKVDVIPYLKSYVALQEDKSDYFNMSKQDVSQFIQQASPIQKSLYNIQEDQMLLYYAVVLSTKQ
jgi:ubiquinone/menaquinone biosynthesis C-methylase UbiE